MKKLLFILYFLSFTNYAQISFEKGYYITNTGEKIECQIKNIDWKNNPTEFQYRFSENENPETKTIESVKEFGIIDISKYKRFTVQIDRSSEILSGMSKERNPVFIKETLF